ncbi:unnamed protein product [Moneuplotes crassus]|uniref:Condensin complex subunit 2 n=1 Tax=Euplotes crassus TaxID=5936 RepID=A0AAD1X110_EUPCR|nr:unnamed protein product [Moneuplotes crassus]
MKYSTDCNKANVVPKGPNAIDINLEEDDQDIYDKLYCFSKDKLRKVTNPFMLDSLPLHKRLEATLSQINGNNYGEENTWTKVSDNIKAISSLLEVKINNLESTSKNILYQRQRKIISQKVRLQEQSQRRIFDDISTPCDDLWKKMNTVGMKTIDTTQGSFQNYDQIEPDIFQPQISYETATCKDLELINATRNRMKVKKVTKQEYYEEIEDCDSKSQILSKSEDRINIHDVSWKDLETSPDEYNALKSKAKISLMNLLKYTKNQGEISRDLDKFIDKRVKNGNDLREISQSYFKSDLLNFSEDQSFSNFQTINFEPTETSDTNVQNKRVQINKHQRKNRSHKRPRRVKKQVVREYERIFLKKSRLKNNCKNSNLKIDSLVNERSSNSRAKRVLTTEVSSEMYSRGIFALNRNLQKDGIEYFRILRKSFAYYPRNFQICMKTPPDFYIPKTLTLDVKTQPEPNYDFELDSLDELIFSKENSNEVDSCSLESEEDIHLNISKAHPDVISRGLQIRSELDQEQDLIDIERISEPVGSVRFDSQSNQTLADKLGKYEKAEKQEVLDKHSIFSDANGGFDYSFDDEEKGGIFLTSRTIDIIKVKKIISKMCISRCRKEPYKRIKVDNEQEVVKTQVPPDMFNDIFRVMKKKNPTLSVHSFFIASLHSVKETGLKLTNAGSDVQLSFV